MTGLLYAFALSPLLITLQRDVGDYVPAGEILPTLGSALVPFFFANVVLAPLVEENIYRGYALSRLRYRYGTWAAFLITCVFFGLLHWAGGVWYMVLTGLVLGSLLAWLVIRRGNLIVAYATHLALNIVEFGFVFLK